MGLKHEDMKVHEVKAHEEEGPYRPLKFKLLSTCGREGQNLRRLKGSCCIHRLHPHHILGKALCGAHHFIDRF